MQNLYRPCIGYKLTSTSLCLYQYLYQHRYNPGEKGFVFAYCKPSKAGAGKAWGDKATGVVWLVCATIVHTSQLSCFSSLTPDLSKYRAQDLCLQQLTYELTLLASVLG